MPLYRSEPVAVAFTEDMSNLLPVDRVAAAGDPPEKAQLMQLALSVDRVASTDGALRLTSPGDDWLTVHGGAVIVGGPPFRNGLFSSLAVRKPRRSGVQVLRFEAVLGAAGCCARLRALQPGAAATRRSRPTALGSVGAQAAMRATVRAQDGPYTERTAFVTDDLGAFTYLATAARARSGR